MLNERIRDADGKKVRMKKEYSSIIPYEVVTWADPNGVGRTTFGVGKKGVSYLYHGVKLTMMKMMMRWRSYLCFYK